MGSSGWGFEMWIVITADREQVTRNPNYLGTWALPSRVNQMICLTSFSSVVFGYMMSIIAGKPPLVDLSLGETRPHIVGAVRFSGAITG
jgi:hypothetical protein